MGFSKDNNFCPCGNNLPLPHHQSCKTFHFVKHTLPIIHIGSFFLLAANMPFHQKCANENLLLCLGRTQSLTGPYVKRNLPCSPRFLLSPTAAFENQNQDKTKQSSVDSSSWTAFLFLVNQQRNLLGWNHSTGPIDRSNFVKTDTRERKSGGTFGPRGPFGPRRPFGLTHGSSRIEKISLWTKFEPSKWILAPTVPVFAFRPLNTTMHTRNENHALDSRTSWLHCACKNRERGPNCLGVL